MRHIGADLNPKSKQADLQHNMAERILLKSFKRIQNLERRNLRSPGNQLQTIQPDVSFRSEIVCSKLTRLLLLLPSSTDLPRAIALTMADRPTEVDSWQQRFRVNETCLVKNRPWTINLELQCQKNNWVNLHRLLKSWALESSLLTKTPCHRPSWPLWANTTCHSGAPLRRGIWHQKQLGQGTAGCWWQAGRWKGGKVFRLWEVKFLSKETYEKKGREGFCFYRCCVTRFTEWLLSALTPRHFLTSGEQKDPHSQSWKVTARLKMGIPKKRENPLQLRHNFLCVGYLW